MDISSIIIISDSEEPMESGDVGNATNVKDSNSASTSLARENKLQPEIIFVSSTESPLVDPPHVQYFEESSNVESEADKKLNVVNPIIVIDDDSDSVQNDDNQEIISIEVNESQNTDTESSESPIRIENVRTINNMQETNDEECELIIISSDEEEQEVFYIHPRLRATFDFKYTKINKKRIGPKSKTYKKLTPEEMYYQIYNSGINPRNGRKLSKFSRMNSNEHADNYATTASTSYVRSRGIINTQQAYHNDRQPSITSIFLGTDDDTNSPNTETMDNSLKCIIMAEEKEEDVAVCSNPLNGETIPLDLQVKTEECATDIISESGMKVEEKEDSMANNVGPSSESTVNQCTMEAATAENDYILTPTQFEDNFINTSPTNFKSINTNSECLASDVVNLECELQTVTEEGGSVHNISPSNVKTVSEVSENAEVEAMDITIETELNSIEERKIPNSSNLKENGTITEPKMMNTNSGNDEVKSTDITIETELKSIEEKKTQNSSSLTENDTITNSESEIMTDEREAMIIQ